MSENMMKTAYDWLSNVRDGMTVYDVNDKKVGSVRAVYFGDRYDNTGSARPTGFYNLPAGVQIRLARDGFMQIDCGFFAHDRLVAPDQIEDIDGNEILLLVAKDNLLTI